jgi:hypothetical protein
MSIEKVQSSHGLPDDVDRGLERRQRDEELLAMFDRAAEELNEEDLAARERLVGAFANRA